VSFSIWISIAAILKSLFYHTIAGYGGATAEYSSDGWWNGKCSSLEYL